MTYDTIKTLTRDQLIKLLNWNDGNLDADFSVDMTNAELVTLAENMELSDQFLSVTYEKLLEN